MKIRLLAPLAFACLASSCLFAGGDAGDCGVYCDLMSENCGESTFQVDGDFDEDACLEACALYPRVPVIDEAGNAVPLGDEVDDKDSLECRTYHANNAGPNPNGVHCTHAGVDGARKCVDFQEVCDVYCGGAKDGGVGDFEGVTEFCPADALGFSSVDECGTFCNGLLPGDPGDRFGNTRNCRLTYALEAFETKQQVTCPEAGVNSVACREGGPDVLPLPDDMSMPDSP